MSARRRKIPTIVNANAKGVTKSFLRKINKRYSNRLELYLTANLEKAREATHQIMQEQPYLVIVMGGDGAWYQAINHMQEVLPVDNLQLPIIAKLKAGTGNSPSKLIGSGKPINDLEKILERYGGSDLPYRSFPLINVSYYDEEDKVIHSSYSTFAGSGWDARVLNDYNNLKGTFSTGLPGYLRAVATKSLPREIKKNPFSSASIYLNSGDAYRIGEHARNDVERLDLEKIKRIMDTEKINIAKKIHPINAVVVGTTPYYGFGFMTFPYSQFANVGDQRMMHVRVITGKAAWSAIRATLNARSVWKGMYRSNILQEFLVQDITVEYWGGQEEVPSQIAGEAMGVQRKINYKVSPYDLKLLNFRKL
ncbi:hypothetical protein HN385_04095 [archaeon]|nr:hypothetical protein [archaeon]MBT3451668.1 hypothetical protein [archaeon]MBT6869112.1 hypothetical protein [archaeon]MBT7193355.1 hypothetical protein [archaeon]MBT7380363.1 hypothetical protein [archaeon]